MFEYTLRKTITTAAIFAFSGVSLYLLITKTLVNLHPLSALLVLLGLPILRAYSGAYANIKKNQRKFKDKILFIASIITFGTVVSIHAIEAIEVIESFLFNMVCLGNKLAFGGLLLILIISLFSEVYEGL